MNAKNRWERGYTITEGLSVIAIAGFALLISIPQTLSFLSSYKLKAATQQIATALQFTRAKAVSQNFDCTFTNLTSGSVNQFQITGGEDDHNDGLHPWEDRNGNGVEDSVTFMPQELPSGVKVVGTLVSVSPVPVTGNPATSSTTLTFNPRGIPQLTSNAAAIYLENGNRDRTAVTVDLSGRVQSWRQSGSFWVAM
jgi:Tfp pilus assembly protein FimT